MPQFKSNIKTAVIPAAGYATRFLPASKNIPKEMFPLINKPVVLHVVEEAVASGIENIIFVTGPHKYALESFFAPDDTIENYFLRHGKIDEVGEIKRIQQLANFSFTSEKPPYGNGAAVLSAQHLVQKDEPFVVVWGDELFPTTGKPRIQQCIEAYEEHHMPVISALEIQDETKLSAYGIAAFEDIPGDSTVKKITRIVEKPNPEQAPSHLAVNGAYVLTPEIFQILEHTFVGKDHELWLTDAINVLLQRTGLIAKIITNGTYLDCGSPLNYLTSQITFALKYSIYKNELQAFLKKITNE